MNRLTLFLCGLFVASLSVSAYAANYGPSGIGMMKGECLMDKEGMGGDCMLMGRHKMTGTVSMINHAKGTLVLKSGVADMTLHFPPDSIKMLKNGDAITVYLGFRMAAPVVAD
ncbi:MAG TPA: hypothetical protein VFP33_11750 [Gallionella sp.]|nr:hypothetical protein [Gallionella sp.]